MVESAPVVGVDLGGTKVLVGVVEPDGTVRSRVKQPTVDLKGQPDALLDRIAACVHAALEQADLAPDQVAGVGMGVPGPLDMARASVSVAPNLGWVSVQAQAELVQRLHGLPVFLENDVRCGALAEFTFGAGMGATSMLALFVGTGIGGGLVQGGRVYHGTHGIAGEIGHMVIRAKGPRCSCGRHGCLEAMAARAAIVRYVEEEMRRGHSTVLSHLVKGDLRTLTSGKLAKALRANDKVAIRAVRKSARYAGWAIGSLVNVLDPDVVVIGGGVVEAVGSRYIEWAHEAATAQILAAPARAVRIEQSRLGDDAGLLGAALTAFADLAETSLVSPPLHQSAPPPVLPEAAPLTS